MQPSIKNEVTFIGTREGLREVLMLLSHGLDFHWELTEAGMVATTLYSGDDERNSTPPLGRPQLLYRSLNKPSPLRYLGLGAKGWSAPAVFIQSGSQVRLRNVRMSEIGRSTDGQPAYELSLECLSYERALQSLCRELSRKLPNIAVSLSFAISSSDPSFASAAFVQGDCVSSRTYSDVLEASGMNRGDLPLEEAIGLAKAGVEDELHLRFDTVLRRRETWSPLAVAALKGGIKGVEAALRSYPQAWAKRGQLMTELAAARVAGRASWLDACIYSNDRVDNLIEAARADVAATTKAGETEDLPFSVSQERCLQLLEACTASATDRELSSVLVTLLSDPGTRLMSGIHPVALLTDASKRCQGENVIGEGLGRILTNLRPQLPKLHDAPLVGVEFLHTPGDPTCSEEPRLVRRTGAIGPTLNPTYSFDVDADRLLVSLLHCGLQGGPMGYGLALAAGLNEEFLFRSLVTICPRDALSAYVASHGTVQGISEPMVTAFRSLAKPQDIQLLEALQAETAMRGVIAAARTSAQVAPLQVTRRPEKGL